MKQRIPNLNTFSTLVDRLSIENVKIAHFQNIVEHDSPDSQQKSELLAKIETQNTIIAALKEELTNLLLDILETGKYEYVKEERTFK